MNLQAGKHYKTRGGRRAYVAAISEQAARAESCIGWIGESSCSWTLDGFYYADFFPDELDLISELPEPKR
jgi:hypothetical protein